MIKHAFELPLSQYLESKINCKICNLEIPDTTSEQFEISKKKGKVNPEKLQNLIEAYYIAQGFVVWVVAEKPNVQTFRIQGISYGTHDQFELICQFSSSGLSAQITFTTEVIVFKPL